MHGGNFPADKGEIYLDRLTKFLIQEIKKQSH